MPNAASDWHCSVPFCSLSLPDTILYNRRSARAKVGDITLATYYTVFEKLNARDQ